MKAKTLKEFKVKVREFEVLYDSLITLWNGKLKNGNNATYPYTVIIGVIIHNIGFDNSDCIGYSHDEEINKIEDNIKVLDQIDIYEDRQQMTHYPYDEIQSLYTGMSISEDFELAE